MASRFPRSSFPRSRMPRGMGRPRLYGMRVPKPPSLSTLVNNGQAQQLNDRICGKNPYISKPLDPDFFDQQWPALLRKSLLGGKQSCFYVLIGLCRESSNGLPAYPELPKNFISWLVKAREKGIELQNMPDWVAEHIYSRLEESEISISAVDGRQIMLLGGAGNALYQTKFQNQGKTYPKVAECPSFIRAWTKWRLRKSNIEISMECIEDLLSNPPYKFALATEALEELVEVQKPAKRKEIIERFQHIAQRSHTCLFIDQNNMAKTLRMIGKIKAIDEDFDETTWANWNTRVCQSMQGVGISERNIPEGFIKMISVSYENLDTAPAGFFINEDIIQTLMTDNEPLRKYQDLKQRGEYISDNVYENVAEWLAGRKRVWDKLEQWGMVEHQDRATWKTMIDEVMGKDWVGRFSQEMSNNENIGQYAHTLFKEWKMWELEGIAPDASSLPILPSRKIKM